MKRFWLAAQRGQRSLKFSPEHRITINMAKSFQSNELLCLTNSFWAYSIMILPSLNWPLAWHLVHQSGRLHCQVPMKRFPMEQCALFRAGEQPNASSSLIGPSWERLRCQLSTRFIVTIYIKDAFHRKWCALDSTKAAGIRVEVTLEEHSIAQESMGQLCLVSFPGAMIALCQTIPAFIHASPLIAHGFMTQLKSSPLEYWWFSYGSRLINKICPIAIEC